MGRDYKWGHHRQSRPISKLLVYTVNVAFPHISSKSKKIIPGCGDNIICSSTQHRSAPHLSQTPAPFQSEIGWNAFFKEVDSLVHSRWRRKVEENVADG